MKKILIANAVIALSLTPVVFANNTPEKSQITPVSVSSSNSDIYVGLSGGWGFTNYRNNEPLIHLALELKRMMALLVALLLVTI